MQFIKLERLWSKMHPVLNEKWVQDRIKEDPSLLGLGDLVLRDAERLQPKAGRLDLLLQDPDTSRRYEVEIQLGKTDESHIVRTIEYWDIERRRYPQYDHCAVIVAEDVTSRFLNIIGLFNGFIPLIALQMQILKFGDQVGIVFTRVLDELPLGLVEDDEEVKEVTNRAYWESRGTPATVGMADQLLQIIQGFDPDLEFKYNKFYIGLAKDDQPNNFVIFKPKKNYLRLEARIELSPELEAEIEQAGLDMMDYDHRSGKFRIRLQKGDIKQHTELLTDLMKRAYDASD